MDKDSEILNTPLIRSKEKQIYVDALAETLTKLLPSSSYFKTNCNTNMGFLLGKFFNIIMSKIHSKSTYYVVNLIN